MGLLDLDNMSSRDEMKSIGKLHVLTDIVLQSRFSHTELAKLAITGGADTIQFRQKEGSTREMLEIARQMKALCTDSGVTFIVNDRVDIAIAAEADGVHLGQDDFPIPMARKLLGKGRIIGGSAATIKDAEKCFLEGADYVGFGPVFRTTSKDDAGPVSGIETLEQVVGAISLPIIAIGGVSSDNVHEVMGVGAYGIAVISAICCQEDPREASRALCNAIGGERSGEGHV